MNDGKLWYQSRAVWGGVIAAVAGVLGLFGVMIGQDEQLILVDVALCLGSAVGGIVAVYGRLKAVKPIGEKPDERTH